MSGTEGEDLPLLQDPALFAHPSSGFCSHHPGVGVGHFQSSGVSHFLSVDHLDLVVTNFGKHPIGSPLASAVIPDSVSAYVCGWVHACIGGGGCACLHAEERKGPPVTRFVQVGCEQNTKTQCGKPQKRRWALLENPCSVSALSGSCCVVADCPQVP